MCTDALDMTGSPTHDRRDGSKPFSFVGLVYTVIGICETFDFFNGNFFAGERSVGVTMRGFFAVDFVTFLPELPALSN